MSRIAFDKLVLFIEDTKHDQSVSVFEVGRTDSTVLVQNGTARGLVC